MNKIFQMMIVAIVLVGGGCASNGGYLRYATKWSDLGPTILRGRYTNQPTDQLTLEVGSGGRVYRNGVLVSNGNDNQQSSNTSVVQQGNRNVSVVNNNTTTINNISLEAPSAREVQQLLPRLRGRGH